LLFFQAGVSLSRQGKYRQGIFKIIIVPKGQTCFWRQHPLSKHTQTKEENKMNAWKAEANSNMVQTVLIISQDAEMIAVWEMLFQQKNCYVVIETSPHSARQTAQLLSPSLIVLELDLPYSERLGLCKELRSTTHGTLLLLAPKGSEQEILNYYNAGVNEHLTTPISPMALLIKSMAWLVRQEWNIPRAQSSQVYA
jgi:CheY-like chemotaxis protein